MRRIFVCLVLICSTPLGLAPLAQAGEVVFGAGVSRFNEDRALDSPLLSASYRLRPFTAFLGGQLGWTAALDLQTRGDAFAGIGLALRWDLGSDWFIDASVVPGFWHESSRRNDLGGDFQFRSSLGIGRWIAPGHALSLVASHKSNANLNDFNPGLETLLLQWHVTR